MVAPIILMVMSQFGFVQTGIETMNQRLINASISEGGMDGTLWDRFLGGMGRAISEVGEQSSCGLGIGLGTNVACALLTGS